MVARAKPAKIKKDAVSSQKSGGAKNMTAITASMPILDILALCPAAEPILKTWGLHCVGCSGSATETIGSGALSHGFSDADVEALLGDLNDAVQTMDVRPETLMITKDAALGIVDIAKREGKDDHVLLVTVDGSGGFCMDFLPSSPTDALPFGNREVPELRVFATTLTLGRIGGATIDLRDGRFKLDLPEDLINGCACGGKCDC